MTTKRGIQPAEPGPVRNHASTRSGRPVADTATAPTFTHEEWVAEATRLFGANPLQWRFVCPSCGYEASVADWRTAGAPVESAGFSCVGRWTGASDSETFQRKGGPCWYAGNGLFRINPVTVRMPDGSSISAFAFATPAGKEVAP